MQRVNLGNTGEQVSALCLGSMWMGTATDKAISWSLLDRFRQAGGNFIDTANCYAWWAGPQFNGDESENVVGEWMQARGAREEVFLATKVGARPRHPQRLWDRDGNADWERAPSEFEYLSPAAIRSAIEGSLRRLHTETIDLYYVHIDDRSTPQEETLYALDCLVQEGKARYVACSNLRTWRLERARGISVARGWAPFVAIQQEYSYFRPRPGADFGVDLHADDELLDYLRANPEVALVAYSPLLKGIYDDPEKRERFYNWHWFNTADNLARLETLSVMARQLGVSNNQLVLAWLLHHPRPQVIPILGASSLAQMEHNLEALSIRLDPGQMETLDRAG
ncbi:MAG: aldo/keto reductase [Anaerolineaceae bacterium]|jgi:aryl-alcohol dehydrogenase-like predicted oxidoreductase|nr:aldo/keto reductase [Anaerolineaceae bacterium]